MASACAAWSAEQVDGAGMAGRGSYPGDITIYCAIRESMLVIYIVIFSLLGVISCQRERAGCPRGISPVGRDQRGGRDGIGWAALGQVSRQTVFSGSADDGFLLPGGWQTP